MYLLNFVEMLSAYLLSSQNLLVDLFVNDSNNVSRCMIFFLIGAIRLVEYLCQSHVLGKERRIKLVVDAGTGTTAIGLGLGALCLGWVLLCLASF